MTERFCISDTHFGHEKCCTVFKRDDGSPLRAFESVEAMDEAMIERWNAVVGPKDKIYHLGDICIARRNLKTLERLNGRKVLVRGNHDVWKLKDLLPYFEDIAGVEVFVDDFILSHVPLHPDCISSRFVTNVHGHLHANRVMRRVKVVRPLLHEPAERDEIDPRYLCVSVEHTDYTPLSFDEIRQRIKDQQL